MSDQLLGGLTDEQKELCDDPDCYCKIDPDSPEWGEEDDLQLDRTGGPTYDHTPLQERVEQQDEHIALLEDALNKVVDVIAALNGERKDGANQIYQAQVDAQDWQNKYNELKSNTSLATLVDQRDYWKNEARSEAQIADGRIPIIHNLDARVQELTEENTQLELRNERQSQIIELAKHYLAADVSRVLRGELL